MFKLSVAFILVLTLSACGKQLDGTQTSTDHYSESEGRIGDLKVTSVAVSDAVRVTFASPDPGWQDPRPPRIPAAAPQSFLARAGCTLTATRKDRSTAAFDPGQSCTTGDETLTGLRGTVWVDDSVLYVEVFGDLNRKGDGGPVRFVLMYPYIIVEDPLKLSN